MIKWYFNNADEKTWATLPGSRQAQKSLKTLLEANWLFIDFKAENFCGMRFLRFWDWHLKSVKLKCHQKSFFSTKVKLKFHKISFLKQTAKSNWRQNSSLASSLKIKCSKSFSVSFLKNETTTFFRSIIFVLIAKIISWTFW